MRTFETDAVVSHDGTMRIEIQVPGDVQPGRHRAVLVLDERPATPQGTSRLDDFPAHDFGPWPDGLSLRREDIYGEDGR